MTPPLSIVRRCRSTPLLLVIFLLPVSARAAEDVLPAAQSDEISSARKAPLPSAVKSELQRYLVDAPAILLAPLHWNGREWTQAAAAVGFVAFLTQKDTRIDAYVRSRRSSGTDAISRAVTPFGSYAAVAGSVAPLGLGLLFHDSAMRDSGRDAIEAEIFAAGIVTPLMKKTAGRLRPVQGGDSDEYRPLSSGQSFPSGHATEAFAVASVFAAHSKGWAVPVMAYALASGVALARVNDRAHYASDVVAGALIGTAIGQTVVRRHTSGERPANWTLVPVTSLASRPGFGIGIHFGGP